MDLKELEEAADTIKEFGPIPSEILITLAMDDEYGPLISKKLGLALLKTIQQS